MPRCFSAFSRDFFRLLKFDHRDLALLLDDGLRRLLHDALWEEDASDDDTVESDGDTLLLDQLGLHFPRNGILQLRRVVGSVVNWKSGYFWTSSRTNVRKASLALF